MAYQLNDKFHEEFTVSDGVYRGFIELFKDTNPLHTDLCFAKSKGFRSEVMHGNILNGFLSYFIGECLSDKNVIIHTQEIQYKNPVYVNDTIHFEAVVSGVYESVNAVEFKYKFMNTDSLVVAKGKIQIGLI